MYGIIESLNEHMQNDLDIQTISKQTEISIRELNRLNQDLWYHGTTIESAENIAKNGVIANYNMGEQLDFGPGFYLTDTYERAVSFISRAPIITLHGDMLSRKNWAIVTFEFNPFNLLFLQKSPYSFHNFSKHNNEFANFVFRNRMYNTRKENPHSYDIIWGVMSDNNPLEIIGKYKKELINYDNAIEQLKKTNSMRQLYIGNQDICNMLKIHNITKEDRL